MQELQKHYGNYGDHSNEMLALTSHGIRSIANGTVFNACRVCDNACMWISLVTCLLLCQ